MKKHILHISQKMQSNWKSGLTVSLVSLPLSVSLAVASNATPTMGIIAAIWAGFFAALFGGSHYNIVGPTGALSGLLAAFALSHGAQSLPALAIVSGILILLAWRFRLEKYIRHIPEHTIQGFTIGVAIIISATQLGGALGIQLPKEINGQFDKIIYFFTNIDQTDPVTFLIFLSFLIGLFLFKKYIPKIPGAIVLSPIGILIGLLSIKSIIPFSIKTLGDVFPVILPKIAEPAILFFDPYLIIPAIGVATVAIIETGISATIADKSTGTIHNPKKEVFGLGLANIASGIFGGIPATAALARTSLNIKSGADHKISGIINAICIIIISFIFLKYFIYIPMAVIASILIFVAYQLVEKESLANMSKHNKKEFIITILVAIICVYEDTIVGIAAGLIVFIIGKFIPSSKKIFFKN